MVPRYMETVPPQLDVKIKVRWVSWGHDDLKKIKFRRTGNMRT